MKVGVIVFPGSNCDRDMHHVLTDVFNLDAEFYWHEKNLPSDIKWHMIGHLQTNKVKHIASFVSLIHAVDSIKLIQEIRMCKLERYLMIKTEEILP